MKLIKKFLIVIAAVVALSACALPIYAAEAADSATEETTESTDNSTNEKGFKAIGAGICVGLAALGGAIGMGSAVAKANEGISRQPEADGKIRTTLMLGLVFVETAIIYALVVAILIIFVL